MVKTVLIGKNKEIMVIYIYINVILTFNSPFPFFLKKKWIRIFITRMLFYECDPKTCPCENKCTNRRFQQKKYITELAPFPVSFPFFLFFFFFVNGGGGGEEELKRKRI